ncbi:hypothetical protein FHT29_001036 [Rhizobium sp. SG741]|nr:hypothetical protein [Rhizobium sp. SG741]
MPGDNEESGRLLEALSRQNRSNSSNRKDQPPKVRGHFGKRAARLKDYAGLPGADTFLRSESAHAMDHAPIFSRVLPARQTRLLFAPQLV